MRIDKIETCFECGVNPLTVGDHRIHHVPFMKPITKLTEPIDEMPVFSEGEWLHEMIMCGALPIDEITDEQEAIMERDSPIDMKTMCSICLEEIKRNEN